jgi:Ras-related protein Rab-1A
VYDITDRRSFENIRGWFNEIEKYASENVNKTIVGNKSDLESQRAVSVEEGLQLAKALNVQFMETSAKNSSNVGEAFNTIAQEIKGKIASNAKAQIKPKGEKIVSGTVISPKKQGCC